MFSRNLLRLHFLLYWKVWSIPRRYNITQFIGGKPSLCYWKRLRTIYCGPTFPGIFPGLWHPRDQSRTFWDQVWRVGIGKDIICFETLRPLFGGMKLHFLVLFSFSCLKMRCGLNFYECSCILLFSTSICSVPIHIMSFSHRSRLRPPRVTMCFVTGGGICLLSESTSLIINQKYIFLFIPKVAW